MGNRKPKTWRGVTGKRPAPASGDEQSAPPAPRTTIVEYDSRTGATGLRQDPADPPTAAIDLYHRVALDAVTYGKLAQNAAENLPETSAGFVERYIAAMQPRNPAERMLAAQMLWQHARLARLYRIWAVTTRIDHLKVLDAAIDAGTNVYRRQVLAWQELRQPRPVQLIAGRQVNVAGQQVVTNAQPPPNSAAVSLTNEQGSHASHPTTAALPADTNGPDVLAAIRAGREALDPVHGT